MGQEMLPVRKIREVLRLKAEGFSERQIAAAIGSARSTVQECVRRARRCRCQSLVVAAGDGRSGTACQDVSAGGAAVAHAASGFCVPARRAALAVASRDCCSGRSIRAHIRMAGSTACSAISTAAGSLPKSWCRAKNIRRATSCSSTTPVRRCRSQDPAHRSDPSGADLRRRAGIFQLHLTPRLRPARRCRRLARQLTCARSTISVVVHSRGDRAR